MAIRAKKKNRKAQHNKKTSGGGNLKNRDSPRGRDVNHSRSWKNLLYELLHLLCQSPLCF